VTVARVAVALFGPPGRGSFNESGLAGAQRAQALGHALEVHWIEPQDTAGRADALRGLCQQGLDLLVAHGGQGDAPVAAMHAEFPDVRFAITQGGFRAANVACYEVLQEQSAFLAGVFAGLHSRTGVVGHLSGEKVRPGLKGRAAFAHGVSASGTGCRLVTCFCGHQHRPALAQATAEALQREGADIVFAMIDGGRDGVNQACRHGPLRQIGNVLDWVERDPDVFVGSAVADSGRCVAEAIDDFASGRFNPGQVRLHGLEDPDFVRLVLQPRLQALYGETLALWQARLLSGEVLPSDTYEGPELAAPAEH
jgi:basic membrane protein A